MLTPQRSRQEDDVQTPRGPRIPHLIRAVFPQHHVSSKFYPLAQQVPEPLLESDDFEHREEHFGHQVMADPVAPGVGPFWAGDDRVPRAHRVIVVGQECQVCFRHVFRSVVEEDDGRVRTGIALDGKEMCLKILDLPRRNVRGALGLRRDSVVDEEIEGEVAGYGTGGRCFLDVLRRVLEHGLRERRCRGESLVVHQHVGRATGDKGMDFPLEDDTVRAVFSPGDVLLKHKRSVFRGAQSSDVRLRLRERWKREESHICPHAIIHHLRLHDKLSLDSRRPLWVENGQGFLGRGNLVRPWHIQTQIHGVLDERVFLMQRRGQLDAKLHGDTVRLPRDHLRRFPILNRGCDPGAGDPELHLLPLDDIDDVLDVRVRAIRLARFPQTIKRPEGSGEASARGDVVGLKVRANHVMARAVEGSRDAQPLAHPHPRDQDRARAKGRGGFGAPFALVVNVPRELGEGGDARGEYGDGC
ncbi:hypothetical protein EYC84_000226 [Monilinia fructicola]|uniref:Uncharacterized protein n=1 Tax=Monilinia fructicola TaxID=38448 RepID=A0A5M9JMW6_MONFR|nr:hypothetical protein EYC84_000226 [Monilinia fructicola]